MEIDHIHPGRFIQTNVGDWSSWDIRAWFHLVDHCVLLHLRRSLMKSAGWIHSFCRSCAHKEWTMIYNIFELSHSRDACMCVFMCLIACKYILKTLFHAGIFKCYNDNIQMILIMILIITKISNRISQLLLYIYWSMQSIIWMSISLSKAIVGMM